MSGRPAQGRDGVGDGEDIEKLNAERDESKIPYCERASSNEAWHSPAPALLLPAAATKTQGLLPCWPLNGATLPKCPLTGGHKYRACVPLEQYTGRSTVGQRCSPSLTYVDDAEDQQRRPPVVRRYLRE